jgi:Tfp pilus assembly protein PilN
MSGISPMMWVLCSWGAVTAVFVILMIYRSLITMREDDQLFLDAAQKAAAAEQQEIQKKLSRLRPYARGLGVASACLGAGVVGLWLYQAMTRFNAP